MSVKKKVIEGFGWNFVTSQLLFIMKFFSGIVMARILMPEDFGKVAYLTSIIVLIFMFRGFGFDTYVVQCDKEKLHEYGGTAVTINTILSIVIFLTALIVALLVVEREFFLMFALLLAVKTMLHLTFVFPSLIQRELLFKKIAFVTFISSLLSISTGIILAIGGFGKWSLIWMVVVQNTTMIIMYFCFSPYVLKPCFSKKGGRDLWTFGKYNLLAALSNKSSGNVDNVIVEKLLGTQSLGYYNKAYSLSKIFNKFVGGIAVKIAGPLFSKFKHERGKLSRTFNDLSAVMFRVNLFFFLIVLCVAEDFIDLVYTSKWLPSVPVLRVLVIFALINPMLGITRRTFLNTGRSKSVGIAHFILILTLAITLLPLIKLFGLTGAAVAVDIAFLGGFFYLVFNINKIIDVDFKKIFLNPVFIALLISVIYFVFNQQFLPQRTWVRLFTHSIIIGTMYLTGLFFLERKYFIGMIKEIRQIYS